MPRGYTNNPRGRNQYRECVPATDETLQKALREYARRGITSPKTIKQYLSRDHDIDMGEKTIQRRNRELGIYAARGTKNRVPNHIKTQLVADAIMKDPSGRKGPRTIKQEITYETGIPLTRDFVDEVMHDFCPEGFLRRHPRHAKIVRTPLTSLGPNDEWAADGHDKLGSIGIAVYGFRDKASGYWLSLRVVPNNRLNTIIMYLYLSLVEEKGGMPLQSTTDCGSETTGSYALANLLRTYFCPEISNTDVPAHRFLKSVHNIVIERGWLRLRARWGDNIYLEYKKGIDAGVYNEHDTIHYTLARWLWSSLLRHEIEELRIKMNNASVRKDNLKVLPSGKGATPDHIYSFPEEYNLKDQLIAVDRNVIRELKLQLGGDSILDFVRVEFAELALQIYGDLGSPPISSVNAWCVFSCMLPAVQEALAKLGDDVVVSMLGDVNIATNP